MTPDDLDRFLIDKEGPQLECKKTNVDSRKLRKYVSALANEGGGHLVLGVTDKTPRRVTGTTTYPNIQRDLHGIAQDLHPAPTMRAHEVNHPDGRVVVLTVGGRPRARAVRYDRTAWARLGESLVPLPDDRLREILLEDTDVTAEPAPDTSLDDLDPDALARFREGVVAKSTDDEAKARHQGATPEALLRDFGLMTRRGALTKAAILMLGTEAVLREVQPNAEIVFEYRRIPESIAADRRFTVRRAILLALDDLWQKILPLDDTVDVATGLRVTPVLRYPERSIRESILNAVVHRHYLDGESVFVRMTPETFEVTSPGPFPATVTPENVAEEWERRNRNLAEALDKCGAMERSGQGVDLMIQAAVRQAQPLPTFEEPADKRVRVTLHGEIDQDFFAYTQRIPAEEWKHLTVADLRTLDALRRQLPPEAFDATSVSRLIERRLVERGRGGQILPHRRFFDPADAALRVRLSSRDGLKRRLLHHLRDAGPEGLHLRDLAELMPEQTSRQISELLREMRDKTVTVEGRNKGARWVLLPPTRPSAPEPE